MCDVCCEAIELVFETGFGELYLGTFEEAVLKVVEVPTNGALVHG